MKKENFAVIMAGGVGSRFWPMSRKNYPKQFIDVLGTGETLIQATFRRLSEICSPENILIVTNEEYDSIVKEQLPSIPLKNILSEPSRKNTAPCVAYAAWKIYQRNQEASMIVAPSDHVITKENEYLNVVCQGLDYVSNHSHLLTLGILPSRPDTGYGYIQFDPNQELSHGIRNVKTFTEKPSLEIAKQFLESGEFVWNSGMFLWSAQSILRELETHMPEEYSLFAEIATSFDTAKEKAEIEKVYTQVRNISIDYGIMEKSSNVKVIPADIGWSDLGTWGSLFEELTKNNSTNSNAVVGNNVMLFDSSNCMIHVPQNKLVVIQGLDNFIVAEKDNTLLICKMEDEQKIKNLVNEVKIEKGDEYL